jgi:hypothetical protein
MSETRLVHDHALSPPFGFLQRTCGLFVAPVRTFAALQSTPRWFDVLLLAVTIASASTYLFASSDRGARLLVDRRLMFAQAVGHHLPAPEYASLLAREQHGATLTAVIAAARLIALTLMAAAGGLAIASVLTASGVLRAPVMPPARFSHGLAIASHAALIPAIAVPSRLLLNLWTASIGPPTSVGLLIPFLPDDTFWAHLGNAIDLFGLWWTHTLALGFAIAAVRRPDGLRLLFLAIYLTAAVAFAAIKTLAGAPSL